MEVFSSHWSIKVLMTIGFVSPHSSYHFTSMSELTRGPWLLRFRIIEEETGVLLFLTSNGVGNLVTVEPEIHPPSERQIVRRDIISVRIIDSPHYSGMLCL